MINENFKPAEWKYVETPYAEMLKHGMMQQGNYDEAVGAMAEYDAKLGALKRIDESTYQNVASKYDQDFRDMYDQYGGDWGAMKNKVKQRLGAETANPFYNLNRAHVEEYEKMQEFNKQLAANGKSPLTYSRLPMSLKKDGKYIDVKDIKYDIERKLEWDNKKREITAFALQDETTGWAESLKSLNREDYVNKFIQRGKGSTTQIGMPQIDKKLDEMYTNYMDSDEGKQEYRALANSEEYKMKDATPADIEAKIKLGLLDAAKLKIHKSTSIDYDVMKNDDYGRGGSGQSQVNEFNLSTVNSTKKVTERPVDPNSVIGKLQKIYEIKYGLDTGSIMPFGVDKGKHMENVKKVLKEFTPGEINKLNREQKFEMTKIFNSIVADNSTLSNIAKVYGVKMKPAANSEDVSKIVTNPVFQSIVNAYDNLNRYYVNAEVLINQNVSAGNQIQDLVNSKPENYEFKTANGETVKIKVKDRKNITPRLDLNDGTIRFNYGDEEVVLNSSEIHKGAATASKNIQQVNSVFQADRDGEIFQGPAGQYYKTYDVARLVANGQAEFDPNTKMAKMINGAGKVVSIPLSGKVAIGQTKDRAGNIIPVVYEYNDIMGGLAGEVIGASGVNSKIEPGKIE